MKSPRRFLALSLVLGFVFLLAAAPAQAAGDDPVFSPLGLFFRWVNTALVFGALIYLLVKKAPAFFRRRREAILAEMKESEQSREEAERRLKQIEERLAGLDQEVAGLREAARRDGAAEAERILQATTEEISKIERAAQGEIAAAERAARMELRAMAARLAVERAESLIRDRLTPQSRSRLFRAFVGGLARSAN